MDKLIKEWERSADKFRELAKKADHDPLRQEGLFCRSEVYSYCADKLRRAIHDVQADTKKPCEDTGLCVYYPRPLSCRAKR